MRPSGTLGARTRKLVPVGEGDSAQMVAAWHPLELADLKILSGQIPKSPGFARAAFGGFRRSPVFLAVHLAHEARR